MLPFRKAYRSKYFGENIVVQRNYVEGRWQDTVENVPNAVSNNQISNQAVVIGNGLSRTDFNLRYIANHRGGLLGALKLQSYGCNALYRDFTPDFLIATGAGIIDEIAKSDYTKEHIVYADAQTLLKYPNKFYLIPYNAYADAGATAAYIAAFDGHKKIFLLGFDMQDTPGHYYNVYADTANYPASTANIDDSKSIEAMKILFTLYNDVDFIKVTKKGRDVVPAPWLDCMNFRQISYNEFALEADL